MESFFSSDLFLQAAGNTSIFWLLIATLVTTLVLLGAAYLLPGVHISSFVSALILAVVTALIIFAVNYLLGVLGLSFGWLGGVVSLIVTTIALLVADKAIDGVRIDSWVWALATAVIVAIANWILPSII